MGYYNKILSRATPRELLNAFSKIDTILLETDGVVFAGDKLLNNSLQSLQCLQDLGKNVIFYPNSTSRSRETFRKKLENFGIFCDINKVYTPSYITAEYLKRYHPDVKKVFMIGKTGMLEELKLAGIETVETADFEEHSAAGSKIAQEFDVNHEIKAVIVSFDENFSFKKLMISSMLLERKDTLFVATNNSPYLMVGGKKYPGVGPLIATIAKTSGRQPDIITCRPNPMMTFLLKENFPELDLKNTCLIGEKIKTDLEFAKQSNLQMMLALSGVTQPQELESVLSTDINYVIHSFGNIAQVLNS